MIQFKPVTLKVLPEISYYFQFQNFRTCDFTMGGLFMWAFYFKYAYAIFQDTLFIKGLSEINLSETAFSIPIGKLPQEEAIVILSDYCRSNNMKLILSAVPEEVVDNLQKKFELKRIKLDNWSDYLYKIQALSSLSGKSYNKKRNHVNKFHQLYPVYGYEAINDGNLPAVLDFFTQYDTINQKDNPIFQNEADMTAFVLQHYEDFHFFGAFITIHTAIAGFIVGEISHDTLFIHINKVNKDFEGINEVLNQTFISDVLAKNPQLQYVNMEEDVGDEGLRKSKLSFRPIQLLHKYNIELQ